MEVSLSEILQSRDNRQARQQLLIEKFGNPILSLTVVMPGNIKKNNYTDRIASAAVQAIEEKFGEEILEKEIRDLKTGFEALFVVSCDKLTAKRKAVNIEENHPLGRLFDVDVIDRKGIPVSREIIESSTRKCLICGEDARICMRNQTHSLIELKTKIENLVENYVSRV